jgi:glycosyltransferase involved in cell wall biosynthesis
MILHLISSEGLYGAENMLLNLMAALNAKGVRSTLGVFRNAHKPHLELAQRAGEKGLETDIIPCDGRLDWNAPKAIRSLVEARGACIIHTHGYKSDLYGLVANKGRLPLVATCHNWTGESRAVRMYEAMDRLALRLFDRTVAVSAEVAGRLQASGTPARKIVTIQNGIDTALFQPRCGRPHNPFTVGFVGRIAHGKGVAELLTAAREVLTTHPGIRFVLAGDGPLMSEMQNLARSLGIHRSTDFLGRQEDMPSAYASLDALVLPSFNEGMPMCLLEGMSAGLPVIATRVGDVPRIVRDGVTGILIEPGDTDALAAAIRKVIDDARLREEMAGYARKLIEEEYSAGRMADRYLALYAELAPAPERFIPSVPAPEI